MTMKDAKLASTALFITAVSASALTMVWLLWFSRVATATTALLVLAGVALLANATKTIDFNAGCGVRNRSPTT